MAIIAIIVSHLVSERREFKGTETCGHAMNGKATPLKTSNFFEHFSK